LCNLYSTVVTVHWWCTVVW